MKNSPSLVVVAIAMYVPMSFLLVSLCVGASSCTEGIEDDYDLFYSISKAGTLSSFRYQNSLLGLNLKFPSRMEIVYDGSKGSIRKGVGNDIDERLFHVQSPSGTTHVQIVILKGSIGDERLSNDLYFAVSDSALQATFRSQGAHIEKCGPESLLCERGVIDYRVVVRSGDVRKMRTYLIGYDRLMIMLNIISDEPTFDDYVQYLDSSVCGISH